MAESAECGNPTEFIQGPLHQKTAEDISLESRSSAPLACLVKSEDLKMAESFAEMIVCYVR